MGQGIILAMGLHNPMKQTLLAHNNSDPGLIVFREITICPIQNSAKHSAVFYKIGDQRNNCGREYLLE